MNSKRIKQKLSQFQGSKKKARKQAFQEREEKRRQSRMLPVLADVSEKPLVVIPNNTISTISVPVLNAMITPVVPDFYVEEKVPEVILLGS